MAESAGKLGSVLEKRDQEKRMGLSELDIELLDFLANAAEPTWIFFEEMPELQDDRAALERALRDLERRGWSAAHASGPFIRRGEPTTSMIGGS